MSKFSDYARAVLSGGLPAALDLGSNAGAKQGDATRVETTAPTGTLADRDTSQPVSTNVFSHITGKEIVIGIAGLLVVGAVLYASIKFVKKI